MAEALREAGSSQLESTLATLQSTRWLRPTYETEQCLLRFSLRARAAQSSAEQMRAAEKKPSQVFLFPSSFLQSLVCLHAFSEKPTGQSHKGTPSYLNGTQEEEKPSQVGERGRCKLASSTGGTSSSRTGQRGVARPTGAPPLL